MSEPIHHGDPRKEPEPLPHFSLLFRGGNKIRVTDTEKKTSQETQIKSNLQFRKIKEFLQDAYSSPQEYTVLSLHQHLRQILRSMDPEKKTRRAWKNSPEDIYNISQTLGQILPPEAFRSNLTSVEQTSETGVTTSKIDGTVFFGNLTIEEETASRRPGLRHVPDDLLETYRRPVDEPRPSPKTREKQEALPQDLTDSDHAIITVAGKRYYLDLNPDLPESFLMARIVHLLSSFKKERIIPREQFQHQIWKSLSKNELNLLGSGIPSFNPDSLPTHPQIKDKIYNIITTMTRSLGITDEFNAVKQIPHIAISADAPDPESIQGIGVLFAPGTDQNKLGEKSVREEPSPETIAAAQIALQSLTSSSALTPEIAHYMITLTRTREGKYALMQALAANQTSPINRETLQQLFDAKALAILGQHAFDSIVTTYTISGGRAMPGRPHARKEQGQIRQTSGDGIEPPPRPLRGWSIRHPQ